MFYQKEFDIYKFQFWSGAKDTIKKIEELGAMRDLEQLIVDIFPEGATETDINDFVWFEDIMIEESLGIELYEDWFRRDIAWGGGSYILIKIIQVEF